MPEEQKAPHAEPAAAATDGLSGIIKWATVVAGAVSALITVANSGTTMWSDHVHEQTAAEQRCIDFATRYIGIVKDQSSGDAAGQAQSIRDANYNYLVFNHNLQQAICEKAGLNQDLGLPNEGDLQSLAAPPVPPQSETLPVVAGGGSTGPVTATHAPLRLFIQINSRDQRPEAQDLATRLSSLTVQGRAISVQGIELVGTATQDSLRCLKTVDCVLNPSFAALISQQLAGATVQALDLSARYEKSATVQPGSFELWFGPGPITLASH